MTMQPQRIFIEHDAKAMADLAGAERPACDGVIVNLGRADRVLGCTLRGNPLGGQWLVDATLPGEVIITWSGTLAEELFQPHPMTWGKPGHEALAAFCDEIQPQLERHGKTLCFQPHARHVLSDPQSCARFLRERADGPFAVALAPATMLEMSMLDHIEDHLQRAFEMLGGICSMVMLSDAAPDETGDAVQTVRLGEGVLPREVVLDLIQQHVPEGVPIVLQPGKVDAQRAWLGAGLD